MNFLSLRASLPLVALLGAYLGCYADPEGVTGRTITESGTNEFDTPVTCTSDTRWTGGDQESPLMHPGGTCITCHTDKGEGPIYAIMGTVFPSAHEPNDCNGVNGSTDGAKVVITDKNGTEYSAAVNSAGNFFLKRASIALPYTAKVVAGGKERAMGAAQTNGECNTCHTESGTDGAPGRIVLPK